MVIDGSGPSPERELSESAGLAGSEFRDVLFCPVATRGGAAAARRVLGVLQPGAKMTIAAVVPEPSRFQQLLHGSDHVDAVLEAGHRSALRRVGRCAAAVERCDPAVDVSTVVDVGHPVLSLVTRAIAAGHDLLAVSIDGDGDQALIRRLLRKSPCPVWMMRPTRAGRPRVLAAVDPDPDQESLTRSIMATASSLAGDSGELHVVNAWEMFGESSMRSSAFIHVPDDEIERRRERVREAHEQAVAALVADRADHHRWSVHVQAGPASRAIGEIIDRHRINTLVIGSVGRSGLGGLVMGNTAEHVIDEVGCSVVAVKPPGFVSPIHF